MRQHDAMKGGPASGGITAVRGRRHAPFWFGVATSAYQTEGGLHATNWSKWERTVRAGRPTIARGERCGRASDSWERFDEDLALLEWLGVDVYRFSVDWSRVNPEPGRVNTDALDRYRSWCLELRAAGIEPMITLHHFTEPLWAAAKGGFESPDVVGDWLDFVRCVLEALGDTVRLWITVNEPLGYVVQGWIRGEWPPGRNNPQTAMQVLEHLLLAHARAYRLIHADAARRGVAEGACSVGLAHHLVVFRPARPRHPLDRLLTRVLDTAYNGAALEALRTGRLRMRLPDVTWDARHPELIGTQDFLGINHYYPMQVKFDRRASQPLRYCTVGFDPEAEHDDLGCTLDRASLAEAVQRVARYLLPVMITEHGVCDGADPDERRIRHLRGSFTCLDAIPQHVDIRGYVHWSLIDNFEWAYGYEPRFGLFQVDRGTYSRVPRPGAHEYRRLILDYRQQPGSGETSRVEPDR